VKIDEVDALLREGVDAWSPHVRMTVTAQFVEALIVGQNEEHIGALRPGIGCKQSGEQDQGRSNSNHVRTLQIIDR
jgi:hypothetical protein